MKAVLPSIKAPFPATKSTFPQLTLPCSKQDNPCSTDASTLQQLLSPPQIWNHPDVLYMAAQKHKKNSLAEDNDIDLEEIQEAAAGGKKAGNGNKVGKTAPGTPEQKNQSSPKPTQEISKMFALMDRKEQSVSYEWVGVFTFTPHVCMGRGLYFYPICMYGMWCLEFT